MLDKWLAFVASLDRNLDLRCSVALTLGTFVGAATWLGELVVLEWIITTQVVSILLDLASH